VLSENDSPPALVDLPIWDDAKNRRKGNKAMVASGAGLFIYGLALQGFEWLFVVQPKLGEIITVDFQTYIANALAVAVSAGITKLIFQLHNKITNKQLPRA